MTEVILVGTSHVSPDSIKKIESSINKFKPGGIGIELDPSRYLALKGETKLPRGNLPFFIRILRWIQKKIGERTGVLPGEDMLNAVEIGEAKEIPVYLIDQEFSKTVEKLKNLPFTKKLKLFISPLKVSGNLLEGELNEKLIQEITTQLKEEFPEIYEILVNSRNLYMARALEELSKKHSKILAVVGAGHLPDLKEKLEERRFKVETVI